MTPLLTRGGRPQDYEVENFLVLADSDHFFLNFFLGGGGLEKVDYS